MLWSSESSDRYNVSVDVMLNRQPPINSTSITFPNFYLIATGHNVAADDAIDDDGAVDVRRNFNKAIESGINFGCQVNALVVFRK